MASNTNKIPITIKRILRILDNPKLLSGNDEFVTVAEDLVDVFDVEDVEVFAPLELLAVELFEAVLSLVEELSDEELVVRPSDKFKSTA